LLECSIRVLMCVVAIDCKQILVDITNCSGFDVSTSIIRRLYMRLVLQPSCTKEAILE
jgi:hypothetical protein